MLGLGDAVRHRVGSVGRGHTETMPLPGDELTTIRVSPVQQEGSSSTQEECGDLRTRRGTSEGQAPPCRRGSSFSRCGTGHRRGHRPSHTQLRVAGGGCSRLILYPAPLGTHLDAGTRGASQRPPAVRYDKLGKPQELTCHRRPGIRGPHLL